MAFTIIGLTLAAVSSLRGQQLPQIEEPSNANKLFNILTANSLLVGDLQENTTYVMPQNLQVCSSSSFGKHIGQSATYRTNPFNVAVMPASNGCYTYNQYTNDSEYAQELRNVVGETDALFTSLDEVGLFGPGAALMFDIDNTIAYSAANDTDLVGEAPPMPETVDMLKRWCAGWGVGKLDCYLITARYCTASKAGSTLKWLKRNFNVSEAFIKSRTLMSGGLTMSCGAQGNVAMKDVLRQGLSASPTLIDQGPEADVTVAPRWIASIGDQYTDSVGLHSGIKIKLPNPWFDSSKAPNQFSLGHSPRLTRTLKDANSIGKIPEEDWAIQCSSAGRAPLNPTPSCVTTKAMKRALSHATLDYCLAQTADEVPDQSRGCQYDISTGTRH